MKYEKLSLNQIKENILKNIGMKKFILIIAALILLVLGFVPQNKTTSSKGASDGTEYEAQGGVYDYEEYTEKRLEEFIGSISGAGKVKVMITFQETSEKVLAEEGSVTENTVKETDSSGGTRDTREYSASKSYLTDGKQGTDSPYVIQEKKPQAQGVVVIAQGADNPEVVSSITAAAQALLNVPVHRIQVLRMNK